MSVGQHRQPVGSTAAEQFNGVSCSDLPFGRGAFGPGGVCAGLEFAVLAIFWCLNRVSLVVGVCLYLRFNRILLRLSGSQSGRCLMDG